MTSEADLRAALETAYVHARVGGAAVLLPDRGRDTYQPRTEHGGTDEGSRGLRYLEWDRDLAADSDVVRTDYIIVTRDGEDVSIHHDVHRLGVFTRSTWLGLLADVGFEPCRVDGEHGLDIFIGRRRTS